MTQLRNDKYAISNYFDRLTDGLGKRGSSISHDRETSRVLIQEFKNGDEPLRAAQRETLRHFAALPGCTVWFVRKMPDRFIGWAQFGSGLLEETITEEEYRRRFSQWWRGQAGQALVQVAAGYDGSVDLAGSPSEVTASDIKWSA